MIQPLDKKLLEMVNRQQGEILVIEKINELVREQNRLEQILDFIAGVANEQTDQKKDPSDVQ